MWKHPRVISPRVLSRIKKMVGPGVGKVTTKRKHLRRIFNYHDVLLRNTEKIDYVWREAPKGPTLKSMHLPLQFLLLSRRVNLSLEDGEERDNGRSLEALSSEFFSILIYPWINQFSGKKNFITSLFA